MTPATKAVVKSPVFLACATLVAVAALCAVAAALVVRFGLYNVAATSPHSRPVYWLLHTTMRHSVEYRATGIEARRDLRFNVDDGANLFQTHCQRCHGAPGVAPEAFALGMMPAPPNLVQTARDWSSNEIYWAIRNGIKMTGMPAWQFRLADAQIWSIVSFVSCLPRISAKDYRAASSSREPRPPAEKPDGPWGQLCR